MPTDVSRPSVNHGHPRQGRAFACGLGFSTLVFAVVLLAASASWRQARAVEGTITLFPVWDLTAWHDQSTTNCVEDTTDECDLSSLPMLFTLSETLRGCSDDAESARIGMKFDLSTLPNTARITNAKLAVTVSVPTTERQIVRRLHQDEPDRLSCRTAELFTALGDGSAYASFDTWNTTGKKTLDLGTAAVADIQERIASRDLLALSMISSGDAIGVIASSESSLPANRPRLIISYTQTPDPPTDFTLAGKTTSSFTWSWTEQALFDTDNVLHDSSHTVVCSAGPRAGIGTSVTCTETGLQPNTSYTRHPNTIDPDGAADGPNLAASTAIETPSGVTVVSIGESSVETAARGPLTNLRTGFSGVTITATTTGASSGWHQSGSWTLSGLRPNTPYTFHAKARNSDGQETPVSESLSTFTLSTTADVTADRATDTWFTTSSFNFTNAAGWGSGGVQYYRYVWNDTPSYTFTGSESTWSTGSLSITARRDGWWYLHVQPFNHDSVANGTASYGPFQYDGTAPSVPASAAITTTNGSRYTQDLTTMEASWETASDATAGVREYQYAIGTAPSRTDVREFTAVGTDTGVVARGLTLNDGVTYYLSVRAVDVAGNVSPVVTTSGILANTRPPRILDRQPGDRKHRRAAGTKYNLDFAQALTGPKLTLAQYAVSSKPGLGGAGVKDWTTIFRGERSSFTNDWRVDFAALREGKNYVSVRTVALDGLVTQRNDVFTVIKDTAPAPHISGVLYSSFPQTGGEIAVHVLGRNFRPGATVWIGTQRSRTARLTARGALIATVPAARLVPGAYDLRVANPNGWEFVRRRKISILPAP